VIFKEPILFTKDIPYKLRKSILIFRVRFWLILMLGFTALIIFGVYRGPVAAQQLNTATPSVTLAVTPFITVTYIEPINVRTGPSSFDYPIIGTLPVGGTASAVGRSPASEWIQIVFPDAPRGTGWVYAANVTLSPPGFLLPIVEPPPTPTPVITPTINLTFVAAFQTLPTSTRLPTFTPPPSLVIPTYENPANASSGPAITTWVIVVLGFIGIVGFVLTAFRRR
jgi:hypothetical protein